MMGLNTYMHERPPPMNVILKLKRISAAVTIYYSMQRQHTCLHKFLGYALE